MVEADGVVSDSRQGDCPLKTSQAVEKGLVSNSESGPQNIKAQYALRSH